MKRKFVKRLFVRRLFIALILLFQVIFIIYVVISSNKYFDIVGYILTAISIFAALHIVSKRGAREFKLTWVFLILLFPVFGGLFYLIFSRQRASRQLGRRIMQIHLETKHDFLHGAETGRVPIDEYRRQIEYLQGYCGFPAYTHTTTQYLSPGEKKYAALLEELENAKRYIFLEYFIIAEGEMWGTILEILKKKAAAGVDVRLIYDDLGCLFNLPAEYPRTLRKMGIKCTAFNPFSPVLTVLQNNRDHRKIAVIDGVTAFTGGINLADEYINAYERFGHWKDASIMLKGRGAWSMTVMFLQMWRLCTGENEDFSAFLPDSDFPAAPGAVQPYSDSPMDEENVSKNIYLQIINTAKRYVYINTPYLILDDTLLSALTLAAKSGVDVRIVTPHRWDKRLVHMTTRSFYRELIDNGVKIYEYSIGFIHSKTFVSDDHTAVVGTANLDFRSLYLHFECGVKMYDTPAVGEVRDDFLDTLKLCHRITADDCKCSVAVKLIQDICRLFAPLL